MASFQTDLRETSMRSSNQHEKFPCLVGHFVVLSSSVVCLRHYLFAFLLLLSRMSALE